MGIDQIPNEYLKYAESKLVPIFTRLFNLIFNSGILPDDWLTGIIKPIYKKKGNPKEPESYRPITIVSCFGKLFTSILNKRITTFLESMEKFKENQAGFRKNYSTTDHIFSLYALFEILKQRKKKLYCAFIDFSKAFDTVWRTGLWQKMLSLDINGKCLRIIYSMYQGIKSCISHNNEYSAYFLCENGVRQGENLSPILFTMYLNDLEDSLTDTQCNGIKLEYENNNIDLFIVMTQ